LLLAFTTRPAQLAQIRAEPAEHIVPIALTTEAVFAALPPWASWARAVGELGAGDRAEGADG
jgi:hypothetical protein